jgi:hypothetical protein
MRNAACSGIPADAANRRAMEGDKMNRKSWSPLLIVLVLYWLLTASLLVVAMGNTGGRLVYPLDDTYIHMAIGKYFTRDAVWGVSQNGFSSSTSSPLWTLCIMLMYQVFGVNDWAPLVLGFLCGNIAILYSFALLRGKIPPLRLTLFLSLIMLLSPLPVMALTGMEHTLHGLLTLGLVYSAADALTAKEISPRRFGLILGLSALVTVARYEGLFLVLIVGAFFLFAKRFRAAVLVWAAGVAPVAGYGLISVLQGWYFLPNSILLKGNALPGTLSGMAGFLGRIQFNLALTPAVLVVVVACLLVYVWGKGRAAIGAREKYLLMIFLGMTLLHLQFASTGWFYRYEWYLIFVGSVVLVDILDPLIPNYLIEGLKTSTIDHQFAVLALIIFLAFLPAVRAGNALRDYPVAVKNIFEQQYQMGLFAKTFYQGKTVALNDIGAVSYLADVKLLDLFGIASMDVTQAKRENAWSRDAIAELAETYDVDIVMVYKEWFPDAIPLEWVEIGSWQITNNVVCGSDTVTFYVVTPDKQAEAVAALKRFSSQLPSSVIQSGLYLMS